MISRLFRLLALLTMLGIGAFHAFADSVSQVYYCATGTYHATGAGAGLYMSGSQTGRSLPLSGTPQVFGVGGPIGISGGGYGGNLAGTETTTDDVSIGGPYLADWTVTLQPQPGYDLFINGVHKNFITSNDPPPYSVAVVPLPSGPSAYATGSFDQEPLGSASSVTWGRPYFPMDDAYPPPSSDLSDWPNLQFNLGLAKNGKPLTPLKISLQPGAGLNGNPVYPDSADVPCSVNGNVQVVTAPQVTARLTFNASNFQLTFTRTGQSTAFATYTFTPSGANMTVTKSVAGTSRIEETDYYGTANAYDNLPWSYDDWHQQGQPVQRHVSMTAKSLPQIPTPAQIGQYPTAVQQVTDGAGNLATSTQFIYRCFSGAVVDGVANSFDTNGWLVNTQVEGYGGANTYTTSYGHTDSRGVQYGQTLPAGSTMMSQFNVWQPGNVFRTWLNQSPQATDLGGDSVGLTANGSAQTDYVYTNDWNGIGMDTLVQSATTHVGGTLVSQTNNSYDFSQSANGQPLVATTTAAAIDGNGNALTTIAKDYRPDTPDRTYSGLPYCVQKPDGTKVDYAYERGTYNGGGSFSTDPNGPDLRVTTYYGVADGTAGSTTFHTAYTATIDPIGMIANRSTEIVDYRQNGLLVRRETYAYGNNGFEQLDYQNFSYTADGRLQEHDYSNGLSEIHNWAGDLETSSVDIEGVTTDYGYDSAGRLTSITRRAGGSVPAQATTYSYDGDNRVVSTSVGPAGGEQIVTTKQYDTGGRLTGETTNATSSSPIATSYRYDNGGQTVTETHADGSDKITTYFADGRVQNITGSAVVAEYHHYDFDGQGRPQHTVYYGTDNGPRYQTTITDLLGRVVEKDSPGFNGNGQIVTYNTYNARGQLSRVQTVLRANGSEQPISADQVTSYDAFGAVTATGLDLDNAGLDSNGNATLNPAGNDRFVATTTTLTKDSKGIWWNCVTTTTYTTHSSSASNQSQTWTQLSGLSGGVKSNTASTDYYGNTSSSTVQVSTLLNSTTDTELVPDGSSAVQISTGGLLLTHEELDSSNSIQHTLTYGYDAQGRQNSVSDSRTGQSNTVYYPGTPLIHTIADANGNIVSTLTYDSMGRLLRTTDSNTNYFETDYNARGQITSKTGNGTYPVSYGYDNLGQKTSMGTSRANDGNWDTTIWTYDPGTGWLVSKTDPSNQSVTFDYEYDFTRGEKQVIRTWARTLTDGVTHVTTTSHYSLTTGDLIKVTYNDGTHEVDYSYNRDGTPATVDDAAGNRGLYYDHGQLSAEDLDLSYYNGLVQTLNYEAATSTSNHTIAGRYSGFMLGYATSGNVDKEMSVAYGYDALGRLGGVTANYKAQGSRAALNVPFIYDYLSQSDLWNSLAQTGGSFNASRSFEPNRDVLTDIYSKWNNAAVTHYNYTTNTAGQRKSSTQDGAAFATYGSTIGYSYQYDTVGQLKNAAKTLGGAALPGGNFSYNYDWAGNRTTIGVDSETANYTDGAGHLGGNNLNQAITRGTLPTRFSGTADPSAAITVGSATVTRQGRYWDAEPVSLNGNVQNTQVNVSGTLGGQTQSANLWTLERPATETLQYDLDGNLIQDSAWTYSYDAENRLVSMATNHYAFAAPNAQQTINFTYDYLGRRVRKAVYLNGSLVTDTKYIYHGWLLVAELDANSANSTFNHITRSYVWGLNASGSSFDGAGSTGGLVLETVHTSTALSPYAVGYDGNDNVAALINTSTGSFAAIYEYDPFGQLMHAEGSEAGKNPFQFATEYRDRETGLVYYGHRFYDPTLGKFINRDPAEESGGLNLYGFVTNDPIDDWDVLGLGTNAIGGSYGGGDYNGGAMLGVPPDFHIPYSFTDPNGNVNVVTPDGNGVRITDIGNPYAGVQEAAANEAAWEAGSALHAISSPDNLGGRQVASPFGGGINANTSLNYNNIPSGLIQPGVTLTTYQQNQVLKWANNPESPLIDAVLKTKGPPGSFDVGSAQSNMTPEQTAKVNALIRQVANMRDWGTGHLTQAALLARALEISGLASMVTVEGEAFDSATVAHGFTEPLNSDGSQMAVNKAASGGPTPAKIIIQDPDAPGAAAAFAHELPNAVAIITGQGNYYTDIESESLRIANEVKEMTGRHDDISDTMNNQQVIFFSNTVKEWNRYIPWVKYAPKHY